MKKYKAGRDSLLSGVWAPVSLSARTEGILGASPVPLTEPRGTTVSISQWDILVEASAAPKTILALKPGPAGGVEAGVGISHPLTCPGGRGSRGLAS